MKQKNTYKNTETTDEFIEALRQVDFNNRTAEFQYK
jgi:hypothetical protein